jgi:hypothetical protein
VIQLAERFVQEEKRRGGGKGSGQGCPLSFAAAEGGGSSVGEVGDAKPFEDVRRLPSPLRTGVPNALHGKKEVGFDGHVGKQVGILGQESHVAPMGFDGVDVSVVETDGSRVSVESGDDPEKAGFTSPRRSDDGACALWGNMHAHVPDELGLLTSARVSPAIGSLS